MCDSFWLKMHKTRSNWIRENKFLYSLNIFYHRRAINENHVQNISHTHIHINLYFAWASCSVNNSNFSWEMNINWINHLFLRAIFDVPHCEQWYGKTWEGRSLITSKAGLCDIYSEMLSISCTKPQKNLKLKNFNAYKYLSALTLQKNYFAEVCKVL